MEQRLTENIVVLITDHLSVPYEDYSCLILSTQDSGGRKPHVWSPLVNGTRHVQMEM